MRARLVGSRGEGGEAIPVGRLEHEIVVRDRRAGDRRGSAARSRGRSTCRDPTSAATRRSRSLVVVHQPTDARTSPRPGRSRTITPASASRRDDVRRLVCRRRARRRASRGSRVRRRPAPPRRGASRKRSASSAARSYAHAGIACESRPAARPCARRREVRVEPRRAVLRHERAVRLVRLLREVARPRDAERARDRRRRARPFPRGRRATSAPRPCSSRAPTRRRPSRRPTARRRRGSAARSSRGARARAAPHPSSRGRGTARAAASAVSPPRRSARDPGSTTTTFAPDVCSGPEEAEVLVGRRDDLVVRRRGRVRRGRCCSRPSSTPSARRDRLATPTRAATSPRSSSRPRAARMNRAELPRPSSRPVASSSRIASIVRARERADAPGLQVRVAVEHRELRACLLEGHGRDSDDSRSKVPVQCASSSPIRPHTRRRTTARSPPRSHAPGRTSSSSRRASASDRCRARGLRGARVVLSALVAHASDPRSGSRSRRSSTRSAWRASRSRSRT